MSEEVLEVYLNAAKSFVAVAASAKPSDLIKRSNPEEWNGAFIIHHMADFEIHFAHRFLRILTEDAPKIDSYDEALYPTSLNYESRDLTFSLSNILALRTYIYNTIINLESAVLDRPVIHPVKGEITLKDILQYSNGHLLDHTDQLKNVIA